MLILLPHKKLAPLELGEKRLHENLKAGDKAGRVLQLPNEERENHLKRTCLLMELKEDLFQEEGVHHGGEETEEEAEQTNHNLPQLNPQSQQL